VQLITIATTLVSLIALTLALLSYRRT